MVVLVGGGGVGEVMMVLVGGINGGGGWCERGLWFDGVLIFWCRRIDACSICMRWEYSFWGISLDRKELCAINKSLVSHPQPDLEKTESAARRTKKKAMAFIYFVEKIVKTLKDNNIIGIQAIRRHALSGVPQLRKPRHSDSLAKTCYLCSFLQPTSPPTYLLETHTTITAVLYVSYEFFFFSLYQVSWDVAYEVQYY